jgi:hypothetical protein
MSFDLFCGVLISSAEISFTRGIEIVSDLPNSSNFFFS